MFHVHRSNRLERLVDALVAEFGARPLVDPFCPEVIAVQAIGARAYLEREIAGRTGVCANVIMPFPEGLFRLAVRWALGPAAEAVGHLDEARLALAILDVLPGLLGRRELAPVRSYVERGGEGRALHAFSRKIAHTFSEYALYRPALIEGWSAAKGRGDWQPILFRAALEKLGSAAGQRPLTQAEVAREAIAALGRGGGAEAPARVSLFGVASLPPLYVELLAALARRTEVHLYASTPSREFYADAGRGEGNRLVAAMGRLGRELQGVLEERVEYVEGDDLFVDPAADGAPSILAAIQSDMLRFVRRGAGEGCDEGRLSRAPGDWSIKVCACRSPLREIETVRDEILAFVGEATPRTAPDGIAVLAPDIAAYAPFVEAVFRDAIPYSLSRSPAGGSAPLLDAASALLALTRARLTVAELFGLVAKPPVMRRLGLDAALLGKVASAGVDAGARFGIDAEHRAGLGLPALDENTWRFALDRVLVGLAVSPEGGRSWRGVFPWEGGSTDPGTALALSAAATQALAAVGELTAPRPLAAWCADLRRVVASICDVAGEEQEARAAFEDVVAALEADAAHSGCGVPVGPDVFAIELMARAPEKGPRRGASGGVVCADLSQMRGVPFRAIFVVGMDGSSFPRRGTPPGFDRMAAEPSPGDRSPRDEDKALFLEAILAAREKLVVTYSAGPGVRQGAPPSSVVSHLLDVAEEGFAASGEAQLVVGQPVEPFAPACFSADPAARARLPGGDPVAFAAASASLAAERRAEEPLWRMAPLPLAAADVAALDLGEILGWFLDPGRAFCERVLGIVVPRGEEEAPEREPFEIDALARHGIGSQALRRLIEGASAEELYARAAGEGRIPIGEAGRIAFEAVSAKAAAIADAARREACGLPGEGTDSVPFSLGVGTAWGPCALGGLVDGVAPRGRIIADFGKVNGKRLLRAWIPHLALCCAGRGGAARTVCFFRDDKAGVARYELGPVEGAAELLARLVAIYWEGQRRPLPFFPATSHAYAAERLAVRGPRQRKPPPTDESALSEARGAWFGGERSASDGSSDAARILFGDLTPWEGDDGAPLGFRGLALDVFRPILARTAGAGGAP